LFNILTGSHQRVGNYPGITVEKKMGTIEFEDSLIEVIDLPGTYSLDTRSLDERVAKNILLNKSPDMKALDGVVVVVDVTNLERSLYLVFELKKLNIPMIVALNLWDVAISRGQKLNLIKLQEKLGIPCVPTSAKTKEGINELVLQIKSLAPNINQTKNLDPQEFRRLENIKNIFKEIDHILKDCIEVKIKPDTLTQKIDRVILHPVAGPLSLLVVLMLMFQAIFTWSAPLSDLIKTMIGLLSEYLKKIIPVSDFQSFIVDGVVTGTGNVIVFLPQIIILFVFIFILEDIGYLGRAALMMDSIMRRLGLPGKAVVPLLSSHACAVPGIMSARSIDNQRDRMVTMLVAPLTTCSARIPVYTLLIAAIVPNITVWGFLKLPGLIMFCMYGIGIVTSIVMAFLLKKTVFTGSASNLLLEIPSYRMPHPRNICLNIFQRIKIFIKQAGTIIVILSMIIWVLVSYPKTSLGKSDINQSYAAKIGYAFEPIFRPIGFDWRLTTALIPSFGAREVVVTTLATVLAVQGEENAGQYRKNFSQKLVENFGVPSLISLMFWFTFSPQCISTIAIFKKETASTKWTIFLVSYTFILAYLASFLAYHITLYLQ
jgi:ferrous iron transport protein B